MTRRIVAALASALAIAAPFPTTAHALEPAEVVVLFNSTNARSLQVAQYYLHARNIPHENLIGVQVADMEWMPEDQYRSAVVPQVLKGLADRKLRGKVKCLVTTYGLPLAIGSAVPTPAVRAEIADYQKRESEVLTELESQVSVYDSIAPGAATRPAESQPANPTGDARFQAAIQHLNTAARAAAERISAIDPANRGPVMVAMAKEQERVAGIGGVLSSFQIDNTTPNADRGHEYLNGLQEQLRTIETQLQSLMKDKENPDARRKMVELQQKAHGLVGEARQIQQTLQYLSPTETTASFDNELSLVLAPQDYPRGRWLMNPLDIEYYPQLQHVQALPHPLMVCRLDGASAERVCRMIDTGLKVEKAGLKGKIYLDARGLYDQGGYAPYDADIRRTAAWLKEHSTMDVVLDDTPQLFEAAKCPDAALYCGWYSLRSYKDSCQWLPGAVGYHVASLEMTSLHNPGETGWVINLLNRGFCGTLGAVAEPYLSAFPKPSQFFPLLMSGAFTQGEVWQVTHPMTSWQIGYVGDPLYNPFKTDPQVKLSDLKADVVLRNAFTILRGEAPSPAPESQPAK